MRHFMNGFVDELLKIAAFPQQSGGEQAYDGAISKVMEQYQGQSSRTALKGGQPLAAAPVAKRTAPTPLTTPNNMIDYASKSGGGSE